MNGRVTVHVVEDTNFFNDFQKHQEHHSRL